MDISELLAERPHGVPSFMDVNMAAEQRLVCTDGAGDERGAKRQVIQRGDHLDQPIFLRSALYCAPRRT